MGLNKNSHLDANVLSLQSLISLCLLQRWCCWCRVVGGATRLLEFEGKGVLWSYVEFGV